MNPRKLKVYVVSISRGPDGALSRSVSPMPKMALEMGPLPVEESKIRARQMLESRGMVIKNISVEAGTEDLIVYVSDDRPLATQPIPGWTHRAPVRTPKA